MIKRITSSDVAKEAGVSRTTVSYILNSTEGVRISEVTKQRVLAAAKKLRYYLDVNAQALKTNRSMSIGVVTRRKFDEFRFTGVLAGIREVLSKENYSILLCSDEKDQNGFPEYYRLYHSKKIDGIIFVSYQEQLVAENAEKRAELMLKEEIPCIFVDYHLNNPLMNCIDINYSHGAYIAAKHLLENGHRKIALLLPVTGTEQEKQRLSGVNNAIKEFEGSVLQTCYVENDAILINTFEQIIKDKCTAIIGAWGTLAAKILYYSNKTGIKIPDQLAVISLGGGVSATLTYPTLSTCELPLYHLGEKSAQTLLESINNRGIAVNIMLPCELLTREST